MSHRLFFVGHLLVVWLIDALALMLLSEILPGFVLDGPRVALGTAAVIGLLNAFVWPGLARFTVRLSVLTLGLWALLLNAALIGLAVLIVPGATMAGPFEVIVATLMITVITAALSSLLAIDQDDQWYFNVVRRQLKRRGEVDRTEVPGVVFLEIDGLSHDVLRRALANGNASTLSRWLREGDYHLSRWQTDLSSQTGACQAGILHGNNFDMPAFRWWDKEQGRAMVTNHPRDAAEMEAHRSDGRGLLHGGGTSRANIFSGDAPNSMLTMSTVLRRRARLGKSYASYFSRPYAVFRTIVLSLVEIGRERRAASRQRRDGVHPRIPRHRIYALVRAWATVVQLDLQVAAVVADILAGKPVIYTTFLAYDEVAHHSGIERPDTLAVLRNVDRQIGRIERALADAPRPYELVALSDHGQSQGATFKQRYGTTLEELVGELTGSRSVHADADGEDDARAYLRASFAEGGGEDSASGRLLLKASRHYREEEGSPLDLAPDFEAAEEGEIPEISVMASGCLGLISFPRLPGRVSLETIVRHHPRLIDGLRQHPGIGFVMVNSERFGAVALGADGAHQLERGRIEGVDPLLPFGPRARDHLLRTHGFPACPDLLINSTYWEDLDEVAAFEELVGSHGGLGGGQSYPFVLRPPSLGWPPDEVVGAEAVHRIFKSWLGELGQPPYYDFIEHSEEDDGPGEGAGVQSQSSDSPGASTLTSVPGESSAT